MGKEALRLSTVLAATPQVIYRAWFDSLQHAAFTSSTAKIDGNIGSKFSLRDGQITGRNMALEFGRRLLQSWRNADFPKTAPDSRLEVLFESVGAGTRMTVMHAELPEGMADPLRAFWTDAYFGPMTDYFGKFATILANTPPSQAVIALDVEEDDEVEEAPKPKKLKLKTKTFPSALEKAAPLPPPPPSKKPTLLLPKEEKPKKAKVEAPAKAIAAKVVEPEAKTKKAKSEKKLPKAKATKKVAEPKKVAKPKAKTKKVAKPKAKPKTKATTKVVKPKAKPKKAVKPKAKPKKVAKPKAQKATAPKKGKAKPGKAKKAKKR